MPTVKCVSGVNHTKKNARKAPFLTVGALWLAGEEYRMSNIEAKDIFTVYGENFEAVDSVAKAIKASVDGD